MEADSDFVLFNKYVESIMTYSEEARLFCEKHFYAEQFKKGTVLLKAGDVCSKLYFITCGLARSYFVNDKGDEKTIGFMFVLDFCTSYCSFLQQSPSSIYLQALTPLRVITLPRKAVYKGYEVSKAGERFGRLMGERYFVQQANQLQDLYNKDVLTRFEEIESRFPGITQQVPQYMIASFLNVSSVHLSRLLGSRFINK